VILDCQVSYRCMDGYRNITKFEYLDPKFRKTFPSWNSTVLNPVFYVTNTVENIGCQTSCPNFDRAIIHYHRGQLIEFQGRRSTTVTQKM
jgi:hypothetical protein